MYEREERVAREVLGEMAEQGGVRLDDKLEQAIMTGLADGKSKERRKRRSFRPFAAWGMALAALLLVGLPWAADVIPGKGVTGNHTGSEVIDRQGSWGAFEAYRSVANDHLSLRSALDAGYVQPVNAVSEEINGYRLRIDGLVADRKGLLALATIENDNEWGIDHAGITITGVDGGSNSGSGYLNWNKQTMGLAGTDTKLILDLYWNELVHEAGKYKLQMSLASFSQQVLSSGNPITDVPLELEIPESAFYAGEAIKVNDVIDIQNQRIKVSNAYIGPSGIYVDYAYDGGNSMQIFKLIKPVIAVSATGGQSEIRLKTNENMKGLGTLVFHNDSSYKGNLSFQIEGYEALEHDKLELVIDTERREISKAPDESFILSKIVDAEALRILYLTFDRVSPERSALSLSVYFHDAEGKSHVTRGVGSIPDDTAALALKSSSQQYEIRLDQQNLPQPLTFTITGYGNAVTGKDSVRIR